MEGCSIDHKGYHRGIAKSIQFGYHKDHRIRCPECKEWLEEEAVRPFKTEMEELMTEEQFGLWSEFKRKAPIVYKKCITKAKKCAGATVKLPHVLPNGKKVQHRVNCLMHNMESYYNHSANMIADFLDTDDIYRIRKEVADEGENRELPKV